MSQHTTSPPSDGSMSPMLWYQNISSSPEFIFDAAQESAIIELEALWHELIDFKARRNQFLGRSLLIRALAAGHTRSRSPSRT